MTIESREGFINGGYLYKKYRKVIPLSGKIDESGNFAINEFDNKGKITGIFKGRLKGKAIVPRMRPMESWRKFNFPGCRVIG